MFNFSFMFDQLSRPLTVKIPTGDGKTRAKGGFAAKPSTVVKHVTEPLVTNTNPSVTFDNGAGGYYTTNEMVWQSKAITNAPRGTIVEDSDGNEFRVQGKARGNRSDYAIYQVKAVNGH